MIFDSRMWLSRKDANELFNRVREVEKTFAVYEEHNKNIEILFIKHDAEEMKKYENIQKRLDSLQKFQYIFIGALTFFEILNRMGFITI